MKKLLYFFVAGLLLMACNPKPAAQTETSPTVVETVKDGIFIHVSSDDPHRVLMALRMAELMSADKDVMMYFDIKGIQAIVKTSADLSFGEFPTSHAQIENLLGKGIEIEACPGCLKAAGFVPEDLLPGIKIADKDKFFSFTKGRILTLDY